MVAAQYSVITRCGELRCRCGCCVGRDVEVEVPAIVEWFDIREFPVMLLCEVIKSFSIELLRFFFLLFPAQVEEY